jgi:hypothetical protein
MVVLRDIIITGLLLGGIFALVSVGLSCNTGSAGSSTWDMASSS